MVLLVLLAPAGARAAPEVFATLRQAIGAFRAFLFLALLAVLPPAGAQAAPYADMVMDARSGEILRSTNADSRLHPASLTKMMTLYVAFEAIRLGEISLDTTVTISPKAAAEPPSKLGLRAGQRIQLRYLIRAAAVKSANDAATAIAEAIGGSEAAFARRMNRTAAALGMTRSTFKNAHGLTEAGHLSTARDMTILGRHLFYDYPQFYNLFSRRSTTAGGTEVANTNRRFLDAYRGADGIKTGYTRAAGFNLVASAERGSERIIVTVFGGTSTAQRNARVAELLDLGFDRAPTRVALNRPELPHYDSLPASPGSPVLVAEGAAAPQSAAGRVLRVSGAVDRSPRPLVRGGRDAAEPPPELIAAIESDVAAALAAVSRAETVTGTANDAAAVAAAEAAAETVAAAAEIALASATAPADSAAGPEVGTEIAAGERRAEPETDTALASVVAPPRPEGLGADKATDTQPDSAHPENASPTPEILLASAGEDGVAGAGAGQAVSLAASLPSAPAAEPAASRVVLADAASQTTPDAGPNGDDGMEPSAAYATAELLALSAPEPVLRPEPVAAEVVTRLSTSGGRLSGVSIGRFPSRYEAEKALISVALSDMTGSADALRRIVQRGGGFEANFMGMSPEEAERFCRRLVARGQDCTTVGG